LDMRNSGNIKLMRTAQGVDAVHSQENARVLSPEQILQSELFSMESVLSPPVEQKRRRFAELSLKNADEGLAEGEQKEIEQLSLELDRLPVGAVPEDRVREASIRAALEESKNKLQELT